MRGWRGGGEGAAHSRPANRISTTYRRHERHARAAAAAYETERSYGLLSEVQPQLSLPAPAPQRTIRSGYRGNQAHPAIRPASSKFSETSNFVRKAPNASRRLVLLARKKSLYARLASP